MKRIIFSVLVLAGLQSCEKVVGEGPVITQTRAVTNFKSISTGVGGTINYTIDPVYKVEIRAQQNILDVIETKIVGDELIVKVMDGKRVSGNENITVNISAPVAESVNLSSSGDFFMIGSLTASNLNLRIGGSGNMDLQQVNLGGKLTANINGSGDVRVQAGSVRNYDLRISGSGKMDLANVVAEDAVTEISGSGDMRVNVVKTLDAKISGSGSVFYRGNPVLSTQVSGSGKVQPF